MRFYAVDFDDELSGSGLGRRWFTRKRDAERFAAGADMDGIVTAYNVPTKKPDLLAWLNRCADRG